ncbi:MAG: hypothetical protein MZV64_35405 [Ignavibacteriales bacterium]|nr:hypothetical protein [Ignavibacteriales bacterium]
MNSDTSLKDFRGGLDDELIINKNRELESLKKEFDELNDKMFAAEERIDELNSLEDELE